MHPRVERQAHKQAVLGIDNSSAHAKQGISARTSNKDPSPQTTVRPYIQNLVADKLPNEERKLERLSRRDTGSQWQRRDQMELTCRRGLKRLGGSTKCLQGRRTRSVNAALSTRCCSDPISPDWMEVVKLVRNAPGCGAAGRWRRYKATWRVGVRAGELSG